MVQNRSILQSFVFSVENKSFSSPQESCAEEVNSPVSLQQWLSFKLRGHYKNFKTGSTSIGRRVFYILKEKRILTQCTMYFPSLTVEIGKQLLPVLHHTCISYDLFWFQLHLWLCSYSYIPRVSHQSPQSVFHESDLRWLTYFPG